ncbi:MAG: acetyl-CoA carboxylase biotin carboxylase subunit [Gemmatimonadota bacterium]|nr:MAG: acetyl-CoA carboxylase biotin carboxylase subunit [Gemmatimonadota bacterium]
MKRVLIANRGEIALRIIRGCHEEGLEAVAVYSEADRTSPHVRAADAAVELGPPPASESYLNIEKLLEAAKATGAEAVHPGYGFLAERAQFAQAVEDAGLIFIGPPASAISAMGDKTEARRRMSQAGVPVIPGTKEPSDTAAAAKAAAADVGYPVLLKASAGGGGKGMRRADSEEQVDKLFAQASSEALSAFGDGSIYVEKLIERPRHVEVQVLADRNGTVLHLGERECSVQRRHQKLIEESPSPAVGAALRAEMGAAAVQAARSVGYVSAGTVEFLLDPTGHFYFLEMNTRLQVEHPITELVYGVDIVREQLRIAAGEPTLLEDIVRTPVGHAIECRITAEDPFSGFLPATGRVDYFRPPAGPGVRWDGGIDVGNEIGLFYDSLLGKLITWGEDRTRAIRRMRRALEEMVIVGVHTSQPFHRRVMEDEHFVSGDYDIEYLEREGAHTLEPRVDHEEIKRMAVAVALAEDERRNAAIVMPSGRGEAQESAWLLAARRAGLR